MGLNLKHIVAEGNQAYGSIHSLGRHSGLRALHTSIGPLEGPQISPLAQAGAPGQKGGQGSGSCLLVGLGVY